MSTDVLNLPTNPEGWALDKHINISTAVGLFCNMAVLIWFAAGMNFRVQALEDKMSNMTTFESRIVKVETKLDTLLANAAKQEAWMQHLLEVVSTPPAPTAQIEDVAPIKRKPSKRRS